jgi:hypothetical protein
MGLKFGLSSIENTRFCVTSANSSRAFCARRGQQNLAQPNPFLR